MMTKFSNFFYPKQLRIAWCQPRNATGSLSGAARVRRLAQGALDTPLGGTVIRTSNLQLTSEPALPPELSRPLRRWALDSASFL